MHGVIFAGASNENVMALGRCRRQLTVQSIDGASCERLKVCCPAGPETAPGLRTERDKK